MSEGSRSAVARPRVRRFVHRVVAGDVLLHARFMEELASRCGQPGAMHWLEYFLSKVEMQGKRAILLLLCDGAASPDAAWGAVLMTEYTVFGRPTRVFSTDDAGGYRTVIAPPERRGEAAAYAISELWRTGARAVLVTLDGQLRPADVEVLATCRGAVLGKRDRRIARFLDLAPTYGATLARMGKSTRFNLGYYRRRLERSTGLMFEPDASALLQPEELDALNERALNPVDASEFQLLCRSGRDLPGSFMMGLRTTAGEWLSLVCGWRQDDCTVLHWQLNVKGREKDSLGTVMRSYLLEHEIARGTRSLLIYGGTPHSMRHAFRPDTVSDIVVKREASWRIRTLLWCSMLASHRLPAQPLVLEALVSADTVWLDETRSTTWDGQEEPAMQ